MTPFACDMMALTPQQRQRHGELVRALRTVLLQVHELVDGFEFEFALDESAYDALKELTPLERACCPFFEISIRLDRNAGKLWWRLSGGDGVKPFIRAEFNLWFKQLTL